MPLQVLERDVGIEHRIVVVESADQAYSDEIVGERVHERAAELLHLQRVAHRVDDAAGVRAAGGHFPQFLDADRVRLRASPLVEPKLSYERFREVTANA